MYTANLKPQAIKVYEKLFANERGLSVAEARRFGVQNLSARISELRDAGAQIVTKEMVTRPGARYVLA